VLDEQPWPVLPVGRVGTQIEWPLPFLLTAIDPEAEAKLDGLNRAVVDGRYLRASDRTIAHPHDSGGVADHEIPVLASTRTLLDTRLEAVAERLRPTDADGLLHAPLIATKLYSWLDRRPAGTPVKRITIDAQTAYRRLLAELRRPYAYRRSQGNPIVNEYWTVGPTRYDRRGEALVPRTVPDRDSQWVDPLTPDGFVRVSPEVRDRQFRTVDDHATRGSASGARQSFEQARPRAVGTFDPRLLRAFDRSAVAPLDTFGTPALTAADDAARAALGEHTLGPNDSLGGYVAQPPLLLTTLAGAAPLLRSDYFSDPNPLGPISAIRVRVKGVHGPDAISRERIREVAEKITARTGLDVDIMVGASSAPQTIALPAGRFGRPALTLSEPWAKKGVATTILSAIDRKSVVLYVLVLVVCALFVANAAGAAVRARRTELGVLACLGWPTSRLFAVVLGELALVGLVAGILGALLALPIAAIVGVDASLGRAVLAPPAAVVLAVLAGLWPAIGAARSRPIEAVRPPVLQGRHFRRARRVVDLAIVDLVRNPGRSVLGALSVAVGVCALTLLLAATIAFNETLVGTLLGDAVSVQARTTDYVAVVAMVLLGAGAVADVLFLGIRERAAELAALRATGSDERALGRLVVYQGLLIGAVGALAGAGLGLAGVGIFASAVPTGLILTGVLATACGIVLAGLAALGPAVWLRRLPAVAVLAGE
jgi:hypothetical protein